MNCLLVLLLELLVWTQGNTESSQAHGPGNSETNGQEKLFWDTAATKKVKEKKFLCAFLGFISFSSQSQVVFSHPMPQARKFVIFAFKRNKKNECRLYEVCRKLHQQSKCLVKGVFVTIIAPIKRLT